MGRSLDSRLHQFRRGHSSHHRRFRRGLDLGTGEVGPFASEGSHCGSGWQSTSPGRGAWGGVQLDLHSSRLRSCLDSRCGGDRFLDPGSQFDWTALCFSPSKFGREHSWFSCSSGACGDRRCRTTRPWRSRNGCWRRFARGCRAGARRRRRCESISGRDQGFGGGSSAVAESCSWGQEGQVQEEKGQPRFSQTSQALQGSQEEEEKVKEVQEVQKVIKLNLFELLNQSFQEPFFEHQFQEPGRNRGGTRG